MCFYPKATLAQAHASAHAPTPTHARTRKEQKYARLTAFFRRQWFRERASILGYTSTACLVVTKKRLPLKSLIADFGKFRVIDKR